MASPKRITATRRDLDDPAADGTVGDPGDPSAVSPSSTKHDREEPAT